MRYQRTSLTRPALGLMTVLILLLLVACTTALLPPAQAVQDLLEVRTDRSEDASAYAEYVSSPELAEQLAQAAVEESASSHPPTPIWAPPYVASETSATADVVVVWEADDRFDEWPAATVFVMELVDGRWVAVDAQPLADEAEIPEAE